MGRTDMVGVVTVPMASPNGGIGAVLVLVPRYGVLSGMGIYCSSFWGIDAGDFRVMFGVGVRVTRGGALNCLGRRRGAER